MKDINLLPKGYKKKSAVPNVEAAVFIVIFLVAVGISVCGYLTLFGWHQVLSSTNDGYKEDINRYSVVNTVINENKAKEAQISTLQGFLTGVGPNVSAVQYLRYIGGCIPKGSKVTLGSYAYDGTNITINFSINSYENLSEYVRNIKYIGVFPSVKLTTIGANEAGKGIQSTIICSLTAAPAATN